MANGTITREEYREKIIPNITNLGAMGGGSQNRRSYV